jgi:hypothetical protein
MTYMYINSVCNATNYYFFHFHSTQHVSALYGYLQVSESVETATLHQCALKLHMLRSIYYYKNQFKNNLLHYRGNWYTQTISSQILKILIKINKVFLGRKIRSPQGFCLRRATQEIVLWIGLTAFMRSGTVCIFTLQGHRDRQAL